jgi:hypothetical protein
MDDRVNTLARGTFVYRNGELVPQRSGPIEAWIIDDMGFPKAGPRIGRSGAAILPAAGQAGQLLGRGDFRSPIITPACLSAIPSTVEGMDRGRVAGLLDDVHFDDFLFEKTQALTSESLKSGERARDQFRLRHPVEYPRPGRV